MSARNTSQGFGLLPDPCPECGHQTLHQSVVMEGERAIVIRKCSYRHCGAQWIDGRRS
jgi:hypothetical protein